MRIVSVILGIYLLVGQAALATEVPVSYLANEAQLKRAPAGAKATFALYDNSNCTGVPVLEETEVPLASLLVERLKLLKLSGAPTPLKTNRINKIMDPLTVPAEMYLAVTGPSITAIGQTCQLQARPDQAGGAGVTQVDTGSGLTGGPITATGTISVNAPTCPGTDKLTWNGTSFQCAIDETTATLNQNSCYYETGCANPGCNGCTRSCACINGYYPAGARMYRDPDGSYGGFDLYCCQP